MKISSNYEDRIKTCLTLAGERVAELRSAGKLKEAQELERAAKKVGDKQNGSR